MSCACGDMIDVHQLTEMSIRIRHRMQRTGVSRFALAKKSGLHQDELDDILRGKCPAAFAVQSGKMIFPGVVLDNMCKALCTTKHYLKYGTGVEEDEGTIKLKVSREEMRERLYKRMIELNYTLIDLSDLSGVPRSTISKILSLKQDARADTMRKLASALGTTPQWLLHGKGDEEACNV